jgi:hypothetical protein
MTCRQEIQSLFDSQIEGILKKIIEQLDWLRDHVNPKKVVGALENSDITVKASRER